MSQPPPQPRQDPAKGTDVQLEFEELGLLPDAPPVPSLCGMPLKYISSVVPIRSRSQLTS